MKKPTWDYNIKSLDRSENKSSLLVQMHSVCWLVRRKYIVEADKRITKNVDT